ncbi:hypothetical protein R3P38DRAFT_3449949 [Favolaschia claudopus]|uniref:Uncharacterized protein n=1 Tax=Favolaschia claudopus TaxID=2862362 RepID=A0AAV9ZM17_9AGAR
MLVYAQAETMPGRLQGPLISLPKTELKGNNRVRVLKSSHLVWCLNGERIPAHLVRNFRFLARQQSLKKATRPWNEASPPKSIAGNQTPDECPTLDSDTRILITAQMLIFATDFTSFASRRRLFVQRIHIIDGNHDVVYYVNSSSVARTHMSWGFPGRIGGALTAAQSNAVESLNESGLNFRTKQLVVVWSHSHALCFSPPTTLTPTLSRPVPPPHALPLVAPPPFPHSTRRTVPPRATRHVSTANHQIPHRRRFHSPRLSASALSAIANSVPSSGTCIIGIALPFTIGHLAVAFADPLAWITLGFYEGIEFLCPSLTALRPIPAFHPCCCLATHSAHTYPPPPPAFDQPSVGFSSIFLPQLHLPRYAGSARHVDDDTLDTLDGLAAQRRPQPLSSTLCHRAAVSPTDPTTPTPADSPLLHSSAFPRLRRHADADTARSAFTTLRPDVSLSASRSTVFPPLDPAVSRSVVSSTPTLPPSTSTPHALSSRPLPPPPPILGTPPINVHRKIDVHHTSRQHLPSYLPRELGA